MNNYQEQNSKQVANTIFQQIGGKRIALMMGLSQLSVLNEKEGGLRFKFGGNAKKVTFCEIVLNAMDTYDMKFYRGVKNPKCFQEYEGVYFDQLVGIIEEESGMYATM